MFDPSFLLQLLETFLYQGNIEEARKTAKLIPDEEKKRSMLQEISEKAE